VLHKGSVVPFAAAWQDPVAHVKHLLHELDWQHAPPTQLRLTHSFGPTHE
jgi:hypothetical protein